MMSNKKIFEEPKIEIIIFSSQDVIATSGTPESYSNEQIITPGTTEMNMYI